MDALETLKKRSSELLEEKEKRLEKVDKDIKATAAKIKAIEKKAEEAHAARNYEKEVEIKDQADKLHKVEAEYIKEHDAIKNGVLISEEEYKSSAADVINELQKITAEDYKKICKLLTELKTILNTERDTLDEANRLLKSWQYDINGRRDIVVTNTGIINPVTELKFNDFSNIQYLRYILETLNATADYMKRYENK